MLTLVCLLVDNSDKNLLWSQLRASEVRPCHEKERVSVPVHWSLSLPVAHYANVIQLAAGNMRNPYQWFERKRFCLNELETMQCAPTIANPALDGEKTETEKITSRAINHSQLKFSIVEMRLHRQSDELANWIIDLKCELAIPKRSWNIFADFCVDKKWDFLDEASTRVWVIWDISLFVIAIVVNWRENKSSTWYISVDFARVFPAILWSLISWEI